MRSRDRSYTGRGDQANRSGVKNTVLDTLRPLRSMSELNPETYAEEGGLADQFIQSLGKEELNATQLRRIFHEIKNIQREFSNRNFQRSRISMIMPLLAYASGRNLIPKDFYDLMKLIFGAERCKTKEDFNNSVDFLEAILAYHKFRH